MTSSNVRMQAMRKEGADLLRHPRRTRLLPFDKQEQERDEQYHALNRLLYPACILLSALLIAATRAGAI